MASWKTPDLHRRLLNPEDAREYVEKFPWKQHGFPEGKPYAFLAHGQRYHTKLETDEDAVSCALALLLDFELDQAMQQKMFTEYEI